MGKIKNALSGALQRIRNPEYSEEEKEFKRELSSKRLLFLLPFIVAAVVFLLLSFK